MEQTYDSNLAAVDSLTTPKIRWSAIIAGALLALVVQVMLLSLGSAIGFTTYDPGFGEKLSKGSAITAGIYGLISVLISLFVGGYYAAKTAGFESRRVSAMHGLSTWALLSAFMIMFVAMGIGKMVGGAFSMLGSGIKDVASAGANAVQNGNIDTNVVVTEVRSLLRDTGKPELNPDRLQNRAKSTAKNAVRAQADQGGDAGQNVVSGQVADVANSVDQDAVANVLAKRLNISKDEANSLIGQSEDQAKQVMASIQTRASETAARAAQATTKAAATLSWLTFFSLLLGAVAAAWGGASAGTLSATGRETKRTASRREINTQVPLTH